MVLPNSTNISLRPMEASDLEFVLATQSKSYVKALQEDGETFLLILKNFPVGAVIASVNGVRAGYLFFHPKKEGTIRPLNSRCTVFDEPSDTMFIHDICVDSLYQGLGLSRILLKYCDEVTRKMTLQTQSCVAVQGSLAMWLHYGFTVVREIQNYAPGENGHYLKRVLGGNGVR